MNRCCGEAGSFGVFFGVGGLEAIAVRFFDTDGKGNLEAVWSNQLDETLWITAIDDLGFPDTGNAQKIFTGRGVDLPGFGDLDGDGLVDLFYARSQDIVGNPIDKYYVRLGESQGGYGEAKVYDLAGKPRSPVVVNYDGDDYLDVILRTDTCNGVLLGRGDGSFEPFRCQLDIGGAFVGRVQGGFFENREQLLTVRNYELYLYGLDGDKVGEFSRETRVETGGLRVASAGIADVNGDGIDDLLVSEKKEGAALSSTVVFLRGANNDVASCEGAKLPAEVKGVDGGGAQVERATLGDYNLDGVVDVAGIDVHDESKPKGSVDYFRSKYYVLRGIK
jgi:hypothetical protein